MKKGLFFGREGGVKIKIKSLVLLLSLLFVVSSCGNEAPKKDNDTITGLLGQDTGAVTTPDDQGSLPNDPGSTFPDTQQPIVSSTIPSHNASLVSVNAPITIRFSEAVNPSSVTVNANSDNCTGTFRLSKDNFQSCVRMNPPTTSDNKIFVFTPSAPLVDGIGYKFDVTYDVVDLAGLHLYYLQQYTFHTKNLSATSFTTTAPGSIYRSIFLSSPDYYTISVEVKPDVPSRVIRQIVLVFALENTNGSLTYVKYQGYSDLDKTYYSDVAGAKTIDLRLKDFSNPSFANMATWTQMKKLKIGVNVVYNDGSFGQGNNAEILLENDGPPYDAYGFSSFIFIDLPDFIVSGSELSKDQWNFWAEVKYPNGQTRRSDVAGLDDYGSGFLGFQNLYHPVDPNSPKETLKVYVDSTGDMLPDYTWSVPAYNIGASGDILYLGITGTNQNGVNVPDPVVFY